MSEIAVGQTIQLADGRNAIVRFVGQTHFSAGDWVGVELEDDSGKNDGAVQGTRYFDCEMGRGMFVRPAAVTVIQAAPPPQPRAAAPPGVRRASRTGTGSTGAARPSSVTGRPGSVTGRPSSVTGRQSSAADPGGNKRRSLNAPSPSPVPRPSRAMTRVCRALTRHVGQRNGHFMLTEIPLNSPLRNHPRNSSGRPPHRALPIPALAPPPMPASLLSALALGPALPQPEPGPPWVHQHYPPREPRDKPPYPRHQGELAARHVQQ